MKWGAAIAASFLRRVLHAEPVAAGGTFRGQTLDRPAGQILHRLPRSSSVEFVEPEKRPENQRDCAPAGLVCQGEYPPLVVVALRLSEDAVSRGNFGWCGYCCRSTVAVSESGIDAGAAGCAA